MLLFSVFLFASFICGTYSPAAEWTDSTFDSNLQKTGNALVMFFAPWCGHCKKLKPIFDQLADKKSGDVVGVVKVDCTEGGKKLCEKHGVRGYPTLKFIKKSGLKEDVIDYDGGRTLEELATFIDENTLAAFVEVNEKDVKDFVKHQTMPVVFGFFKDTKSKLFQEFSSVSSSHRKNVKFGYSLSKDVASKMDQKLDTVVLYRQLHLRTNLDADFMVHSDHKTLDKFISENHLSKIGIRVPTNEKLFSQPLIVSYISAVPEKDISSFRRFRNRILNVQKKFKGLNFAISFHKDYTEFLGEFSKTVDSSNCYLVGYDETGQKFVFDEDISIMDAKTIESKVTKFIENFKKGDVYPPHIKSQPIPEASDEPVKVVVAKNFKEIVLDESKDVLIEFYAPWCGHCKKLEPIYNELASLLKAEESLVIAKMDATENEAQPNFSVSGFPTIYFAKAGSKDSPIAYDGERDVKSFVSWLKKHATHPLKYDGEVPDSKKEL